MNNGFLNILKPSGPTSSDIVVKLRKLLNVKKIGHLGTLDPLAAGVLPVAAGKATRLFDYLTFKKKKYRAVFCFGISTDTADSSGKIIEKNGKIPSLNDVNAIIKKFTGNILQIPPKYSAINIGGQKAYDLARQGKEFKIGGREVTVYSLEAINAEGGFFTFDIECSGGTYIRSLCTDIASALGTVAYMSMLIRLYSGCFDISDSVLLEDIENSKEREKFVIPMEFALKDFKRLDVNEAFYKELYNGVSIHTEEADEKNILVYCKNELFGIGNIEYGNIRLKTNLR